jgi:zinc/manganese transport system permease protein
MTAALDPGLLLLPWLAGLIVLASHVPLGREVLRRGIVFVDLAVAQIAGLGVMLAHALDWHTHGFETQLAAAGAALAAAALLAWLERRWPESLEALIGGLFVIAASAAALLSAHDPHGSEHIQELLVGQVLWVGWDSLLPALVLTALLLLAWWRGGGRQRWLFHACLALAVTASVQLVGVYLVFASLIFPALAVRGLAARPALAWGWGLGAAAYGLGLAVSAMGDWPAGPVIVLVLAGLALAVGRSVPAGARLN